MAKLARAAHGAAVELAVGHHASANTVPSDNGDKVVDPEPGTKPLFGDSKGSDIIFEQDRNAEARGERCGERYIAPTKVGRDARDTSVRIDNAIHADTDAEQPRTVNLRYSEKA